MSNQRFPGIGILFLLTSLTVACLGQTSTNASIGNPEQDQLRPTITEEKSVEVMIYEILGQMRNKTAITLPGFDIPDPMPIEDFDTSIEQGMTTADVQLWNVSITGLSKFVVDRVTVRMGDMHVGIGMNLTDLQTKGEYDLQGRFSFFRLTGNGGFYLNISHAYVSGNIYLNGTEDGGIQVEDVQLDIAVTDLILYFENLMGRGMMARFMNSIVNTMSAMIFDSVKPTVLDELQNTVKQVLNEQFENLPAQPMLGRSASPLDLAFANTATQIRENDLDPLSLPDQNKSFNRKMLFVSVHGDVHLEGGYLTGLSSLQRTGDITMVFKENVLDVSAELGFARLEGGYKWKANFMGIHRKGGLHFFVNDLQLMFNATQTNAEGSHPLLTDLQIKQIRLVGVDVDGLGSLDFLLEFFSNFLTNVFKKQFSRILETHLKTNIQNSLNEVRLPF